MKWLYISVIGYSLLSFLYFGIKGQYMIMLMFAGISLLNALFAQIHFDEKESEENNIE